MKLIFKGKNIYTSLETVYSIGFVLKYMPLKFQRSIYNNPLSVEDRHVQFPVIDSNTTGTIQSGCAVRFYRNSKHCNSKYILYALS
jgi:hypothetical protein